MARQYHWWIATRDETGKPYLIYGSPDFGSDGGEEAARAKGIEMLGGLDFRTVRYPTPSLSEASSYHRGKRLESGEGLKRSTQRLGHERSIDRLRKRLARKRSF